MWKLASDFAVSKPQDIHSGLIGVLHQAEGLDILGEDVAPVASLGRGLDVGFDTDLLSDNGLEQEKTSLRA